MAELNISEAISRSYNTLSNQIELMLDVVKDDDLLLQLNAFDVLFQAQFKWLSELANKAIDDNNSYITELEYRDNELVEKQKEILTLLDKLNFSSEKLNQMVTAKMNAEALLTQVTNQRDAYKADADKASVYENDFTKAKARADRLKDSNAKLETSNNQLNQQVQQLSASVRRHKLHIDDMNTVYRIIRQSMLYEGFAPVRDIQINGETFFFYKKPVATVEAFRIDSDEYQISRMHQYFIQLQSTNGVHYDLVPIEGGGFLTPPVVPIPDEIRAIVNEEFDKEQLFNPQFTMQFHTQTMQKIFNETERLLNEIL